jgi:hypothetical protein
VAADRRIGALVAASVRDFTAWYDHSKITAWTVALVKSIQPIQRVLARSTDTYLARASTITTGRSVRPVGAVDVSKLRANQTHAGAYGRVADTYRYQAHRLEQPGPKPALVSPQQAASTRASAVAEMDALLPARKQAQAFMVKQPKITGYRRVIHPELSVGGTCGLCVAASDRLYKPQDLMPIHDRCHCLPMPVYDFDDPGSLLNEGDLTRLYEDAGGKSYGGDLKRTRYKIVQHGELGPTLVPADANVRTVPEGGDS